MRSQDTRGHEKGEEGFDDFQALRDEVLLLREAQKKQAETESSLIQELQRRCDRVIELEVCRDRLTDDGRNVASYVRIMIAEVLCACGETTRCCRNRMLCLRDGKLQPFLRAGTNSHMVRSACCAVREYHCRALQRVIIVQVNSNLAS